MSTGSGVFELGPHKVQLLRAEPDRGRGTPGPPKPLLVFSPGEAGEFPVLVFLHGYLIRNSFYSQLIQHVSSHGFIVIAPQLYLFSGPDTTDEIKSAAATVDWLEKGLRHLLPESVLPNLTKLAISGHSRGGKVAFALARGLVAAPSTLKFSALMGIDPVDGMGKGKQTPPPVLTYAPNSFDASTAAVMVIGSGLGEVKRNPLFPACAPSGVNHKDFFAESRPPACHFVARDFGHTDMLDDETPGLIGKATYCTCKNGPARGPMRKFVAGAMVAFMKAYVEGDARDLLAIRDNPGISPVALSTVEFLLDEDRRQESTI